MQRFPQIDENSSDNFPSYRSTDFISEDVTVLSPKSVQQITKRDIPINMNRSQSFSEGRNKTISTPTLIRKGILYYKNKF